MANEIYIALPEDPAGALEIRRERGGALEPVTQPFTPPRGVKVTAIAPATRIAHFVQPLAARGETEALRAAPFAIEDELAQPVEEVHVALGPRRRDLGPRSIYAADRELLNAWIARLEEEGFPGAVIIAEQSLAAGAECAVQFASHQIQPYAERLVGIDANLPAALQSALVAEGGLSKASVQDRLAWLASRSRETGGVNLRTGPYAPKAAVAGGARAWQLCGMLVLVLAALWTGIQFAEAHQHRAAAMALEQRAASQYAAMFPASPPPANLDLATRQIISAETQAGFAFLPVAAAVYEAIALTPGARLTALHFDGAAQSMEAGLVYDSPEIAADLAATLAHQGYEVSVAADEGGLSGQLRIGAKQ